MQLSSLDLSEQTRLDAIDRLDLFETPSDRIFDTVTSIIRNALDVELAWVAVADAHSLVYKSIAGLALDQAERDGTFCDSVIRSSKPLILPDTALDPTYATNRYAVGPNGIRFYAGFPLVSSQGHVVGSICAADLAPRKWGRRDGAVMSGLSTLTMSHIELADRANYDALTGVLSRRFFLEHATSEARTQGQGTARLSVIVFDIDRFKSINDTHGHAAGDEVLKEVAARSGSVLRDDEIFGRVGGEEFALLLPGASALQARKVAERLRAAIAREPIVINGESITVTASFGVAEREPSESCEALMIRADHAMYLSKQSGRDRVTVASGMARRQKVLRAARIVPENGVAIACTIRSLGPDGAGIAVNAATEVPDRFDLIVKDGQTPLKSVVEARGRRHLEVAFARQEA